MFRLKSCKEISEMSAFYPLRPKTEYKISAVAQKRRHASVN